MALSETIRQQIRERAKYHCEYCKGPDEIMGSAFEMDHIQLRSRGGTDDLDNLCYACRDCNMAKSNHENVVDQKLAKLFSCLILELRSGHPILNFRKTSQ